MINFFSLWLTNKLMQVVHFAMENFTLPKFSLMFFFYVLHINRVEKFKILFSNKLSIITIFLINSSQGLKISETENKCSFECSLLKQSRFSISNLPMLPYIKIFESLPLKIYLVRVQGSLAQPSSLVLCQSRKEELLQ